MRFLVRHNRHHKVSRSSYVAKLLLFCEKLGLGGHFVMPIQFTRNLIMRVYWTTLNNYIYWFNYGFPLINILGISTTMK